jgi:arylsulfatase
LQFLEQRGLRQLHLDDFARRDKLASFVTPLPDDAYCDNWIGQNGLDLLAAAPADQSWFLQINFTGPHNPWDITESMAQLYAHTEFPQPAFASDDPPAALLQVRRNYAAMIENIDRWLGLYIEVLAQRGELDNTLVVFSSDHGEMLGDHGRWGKSLPQQPSIGVPLTIAGPGVRAFATTDAPTTILDLVSTFLEMAEARELPAMDSRSLWPLLSGQVPAGRDVVFSALDDWRLVFDGRYKLVESGDSQSLYDLQRDPVEQVDLIEDAALGQKRQSLQEQLQTFL